MKLKRFFWTLSGDDSKVIGKCDGSTRKRFTAIGMLVGFIFALCFVSCYFALTKLLQNYWTGIPIGIFFASMITNIYLFLLYTLSKTGFPYIPNRPARYISITIRLIFIAFFAIIVSKPVESLVFSDLVNEEIIVFKENKRKKFIAYTEETYDAEIAKYEAYLFKKEDEFYRNLVNDKKKRKQEAINSINILVQKSDYYIQGMLILNTQHPICWAITLFVLIIFIIPAYLKIFIHKDSIFYKTKHFVESELVKYEYEVFKENYNNFFREQYGIHAQYTENYIDPPFNTKRKKEQVTTLNEDDLLKSLYA